MEHILNPPNALILMESTRSVGYTLESAVADIIDNSIAAGAVNIELFFSPVEQPYFAILDNGIGMSKLELINAMKYGSNNPKDSRNALDLGRFGLGLKTASLSQCRVLTVVTKRKNSVFASRWDLNYIKENNDWYLLQLDESEIGILPKVKELMALESGTLVIWSDLDKLAVSEKSIYEAFNKKIPILKKHLELVFHRYLNGEKNINKICIHINNLKLDVIDPFLKHKSHQVMDVENLYIKKSQVSITPYILPHQSKLTKTDYLVLGGKDGLRKRQGFYIYRNRRLLVSGTWFRLVKTDDLSKLARVQVDIPNTLDEEWTLDIKKSIAIPPDSVKTNLKRIVDRIATSSKRVYKTRSKIEFNDLSIHPWLRSKLRDGSILYSINRDYPLIEVLNKILNDDKRLMLEQLLNILELNIPINTIRIDLNNEKHLALDNVVNNGAQKDICNLINNIFKLSDNSDNIKDLLMITEPFLNYPNIITSIYKEYSND